MTGPGLTVKNQQQLKNGYTTGTCAAAAARAATQMLLLGTDVNEVQIRTPDGTRLRLPVADISRAEETAVCCVRKDSGDDPDITNGICIYARIRRCAAGIELSAGEGVGTVTKPGLEQPVGAPAINKVPRQMIREAVQDVCESCGYEAGIAVEISVPGGAALARKTFNPKLGIEGGISILGTSGIVEPMSEKAVLDTIILEMRMKQAAGCEYLLVSPGNYGVDYCRDMWQIKRDDVVKCSNFIGDVIDAAAALKLKGILFVAHVGKFIKVSGGIMNTHSRYADARMELLAAHVIRAGSDADTAAAILAAPTTEEGLNILARAGLLRPTMAVMTEQIEMHLKQRAGEDNGLKTGAVIFSGRIGELGRTAAADELLSRCLDKRQGREGDR